MFRVVITSYLLITKNAHYLTLDPTQHVYHLLNWILVPQNHYLFYQYDDAKWTKMIIRNHFSCICMNGETLFKFSWQKIIKRMIEHWSHKIMKCVKITKKLFSGLLYSNKNVPHHRMDFIHWKIETEFIILIWTISFQKSLPTAFCIINNLIWKWLKYRHTRKCFNKIDV